MGIMDCDIHGPQGFYHVCVHVSESIDRGRFPVTVVHPVLYIGLCKACYLNHRQIMDKHLVLDEALLDSHRADADELSREMALLYDHVDSRMRCAKCVNTLTKGDAKT